ncbi:hypothetical protein [Actinomarinicola tropica]|uniref:Uncharacterized protein n=1 Tax=Actinomarinicola tropica TaxID=2789776 RepID=A0A5Q2RIU9_9ACTN|nr:hypothetical protein [Actinomarinicola tropica]QGG94501.1 hypothetical protein GH723_04940 [Actinomarinicola tropica]
MTQTEARGAGATPPVVAVVASSTSTSLVVHYDGSRPPTALFAAWTGLGWRAPVPASPPRDAIDWATPDPVRGTNHTIRPFAATGTATLDDGQRRDVDDLVGAALDLAAQLGCDVERPVPAEIDLRDGAHPTVDAVVDLTDGPRTLPRAPRRTPRLRRGRGAQARVRATIPTAEVDEVARIVGGWVATLTHEPEDRPDDEAPRSRVTVEVAAADGDAVMRCLAARSTGTPMIEIVTAGARTGADR